MKKLMLVLALVVASLTINTTYAQTNKTATVEEWKAAVTKGIITKPTPQVIKWCETGPSSALYFPIKDEIVWYKYKGLFYSTYYGPEGIDVVVLAPEGEFVNYFHI
jgi:hypothetical protein